MTHTLLRHILGPYSVRFHRHTFERRKEKGKRRGRGRGGEGGGKKGDSEQAMGKKKSLKDLQKKFRTKRSAENLQTVVVPTILRSTEFHFIWKLFAAFVIPFITYIR